MNIKSLLLGSAAALVAVSGARAADAVVIAEPEPMDYVRVCDTYGAGYYYIPGTETCLSIRGLVRYQISFDDDDDGWRKNAYARLDINAKSETELGTLTGYMRIVGNNSQGQGYVDAESAPVGTMYMEYASISLGGLTIGLVDSIYDVDVGAEWDVSGAGYANAISYTFAGGNGFSATVALEEEDNNSNYIPNVVARVGITQGWGSADLFVAYDDDDDSVTVGPFVEHDDGVYVKGVVVYKFTDTISLAGMGIWESDFGGGAYSTGYEWSVAAHLEAALTEKVAIGFGGQYFADSHFGGGDGYSVGGEVAYKIVENFSTKLQIQYDDFEATDEDDEVESWNGWLRFERSF